MSTYEIHGDAVDSQGNATPFSSSLEVSEPSAFDGFLAGTYTQDVIIPVGETWGIDGDVVFDNVSLRVQGTLRHDSALDGAASMSWINIDETLFVGGGMEFLDSDKGLWVEDGLLDIHGTPKTSWTRLAGSASGGATSLELIEAPTGWQVGDKLIIAPSEPISVGDRSWQGFESVLITGVNGNTITIDTPLGHDHPSNTSPRTGRVFTAEVMNITRDLLISGESHGSGRAHVIVMSNQVQKISHVEFQFLGPRDGDDPMTGRYPLHFHHCGENSRGTLLEGLSIHHCGNRGPVPHASHGITGRDIIVCHTKDEAYWWDPPPWQTGDPVNDSNDILYDHCIAALIRSQPAHQGARLAGFWLGPGVGNKVRNCVAVGIEGGSSNSINASGFIWPETSSDPAGSGIWEFNQGNISHNNRHHGIFTWQNDAGEHVIANTACYNNMKRGVDHGAYVNAYQYLDMDVFGNGEALRLHSQAWGSNVRADGYSQTFENYLSDGRMLVTIHNNSGQEPTLIKDSVFTDVVVTDFQSDKDFPTWADFVNCTKPDGSSIEPSDFDVSNAEPGMNIRVQRPDGTAYRLEEDGTGTSISPFYGV